jgi:hypothetical protein
MVAEKEVVPLRSKSRELVMSKSTNSTVFSTKKPLNQNINILNQTKQSAASFNSRKSKKQNQENAP